MAKKVVEMASEEVVDEKKILKEAETREKERKEEEKIEKEAAKESHSAEATRDKEEKQIQTKRKKPKHGKKYRELAKLIELEKEYPISEAIELALKTSPTKFDASVEAHIKINPKEKNIRGMVMFAGGVSKEKKVLEVSEKNVDEAIADIKTGKINFDIIIADIKVMPKLAILAKVLGPKGLMPSPKAGTAVEDVKKAVEELKSGKVEYRTDSFNIIHMALGKISFGPERIHTNYEALVNALPIKKIESIYLSSTMGPSIRVARK